MSTTNLRSVLQLMREDKYPRLYADAMKELEAIERAAKAMNESVLDREQLRATALLMQSIAKDAP